MKDVLLVVDNLDQWQIILGARYSWLLPGRHDSCHVLLLSRSAVIPDSIRKRLSVVIDVLCLSKDDAVEMMISLSGIQSIRGFDKQNQAAQDGLLVKADLQTYRLMGILNCLVPRSELAAIGWLADDSCLSGLPLALEMIAAYVRVTGLSFEHCRQLFQEPMKGQGGQSLDHSVLYFLQTTLTASYGRLSQPAKELLQLSAFLAPDFIPCQLFLSGQAVVSFPPALRRTLFPPSETCSSCEAVEVLKIENRWSSLVCELRHFSIANWVSATVPQCGSGHLNKEVLKAFGIHRLVQSAVLNSIVVEGRLDDTLNSAIEMLLLCNSRSHYTFSCRYLLQHMLAVDEVATALHARASTGLFSFTSPLPLLPSFQKAHAGRAQNALKGLIMSSPGSLAVPARLLENGDPMFSQEVHFNWSMLILQILDLLYGVSNFFTEVKLTELNKKGLQVCNLALMAGDIPVYHQHILGQFFAKQSWRVHEQSNLLVYNLERLAKLLFEFSGHARGLERLVSYFLLHRAQEKLKYNQEKVWFGAEKVTWTEFNLSLAEPDVRFFNTFDKHSSTLVCFLYYWASKAMSPLETGVSLSWPTEDFLTSRGILREVKIVAQSFIKLVHLCSSKWVRILEDEDYVITDRDIVQVCLASREFLFSSLVSRLTLLLLVLAGERYLQEKSDEGLVCVHRFCALMPSEGVTSLGLKNALYPLLSRWIGRRDTVALYEDHELD